MSELFCIILAPLSLRKRTLRTPTYNYPQLTLFAKLDANSKNTHKKEYFQDIQEKLSQKIQILSMTKYDDLDKKGITKQNESNRQKCFQAQRIN